MNIPTSTDLCKRDDLVPIGEICDQLVECLHATSTHERKATVVVTYEIEYDEEDESLSLYVKTKSKRPVRPSRNEEIIGDRNRIFSLSNDAPGQERIPGTEVIRLNVGATGVTISKDGDK